MAEGVKKKKKKCVDAEDRISGLSDSLIHHILSFLRMKDVIRTCLLARRWRYLWRSVPVLEFGNIWSDDIAFIDRSLILYEGRKIRRFHVVLRHIDSACRAYSWISFAVRRDVEELDIEFYYLGVGDCQNPFKLPSCVLDCGALRELRLGCCVINLSASFYCRSLTTLHLFGVKSTYLDTSGFPVLENLIMEACNSYDDLNIYAPNQKLRCLKMMDHGDCFLGDCNLTIYAPYLLLIKFTGNVRRSYNFKNLSSIQTASLEIFSVAESNFDSLVELLKHLGHAKTLKLCQNCIQILAYRERNKLKMPPLSATCLKLQTTLSEYQRGGIATLLGSCHCLETLIINIHGAFNKSLQGSEIKAWELLEHALFRLAA